MFFRVLSLPLRAVAFWLEFCERKQAAPRPGDPLIMPVIGVLALDDSGLA